MTSLTPIIALLDKLDNSVTELSWESDVLEAYPILSQKLRECKVALEKESAQNKAGTYEDNRIDYATPALASLNSPLPL